jgi:hypothetical protein
MSKTSGNLTLKEIYLAMSKKLKEGGVFYPDHIYTLPSPGGEKALI